MLACLRWFTLDTVDIVLGIINMNTAKRMMFASNGPLRRKHTRFTKYIQVAILTSVGHEKICPQRWELSAILFLCVNHRNEIEIHPCSVICSVLQAKGLFFFFLVTMIACGKRNSLLPVALFTMFPGWGIRALHSSCLPLSLWESLGSFWFLGSSQERDVD